MAPVYQKGETMLHIMSDEEVKAQAAEVRKLKRSKKLHNKIAGILMDMNIGKSGMNRGPAIEKGKGIIKFLERRGLLKK
jgi:hypothetical protein